MSPLCVCVSSIGMSPPCKCPIRTYIPSVRTFPPCVCPFIEVPLSCICYFVRLFLHVYPYICLLRLSSRHCVSVSSFVVSCVSAFSSVARLLRSNETVHEELMWRMDEALDDAFAEEFLDLRASCWDVELDVSHLRLYVVSYIRLQLPHTNKLVPNTHQVLQQVFLHCFPLCVCLVPVTHVCPSIYVCVPHRMFLQSLRELERALRTLW